MDSSENSVLDRAVESNAVNAAAITYGVFGFIAGVIATLLLMLIAGTFWPGGAMHRRMLESPEQRLNPPAEQLSPLPGER
jgi:hypothetical protein